MPTCKKVVFCLFFLLFVCRGFVFCLCVFIFWFGKRQKGFFSCNFRVFFLFYVPQRPVFKSLLFFLFCFLFWFSFCLPFQNSIFFFAFCPSTPFGTILIFGVSLSFFFLPFPFLMFAWFFQTNFPNIPFLKPKLLSFLVVYFFCCFDFIFMFHVSAFLF